MTKIRIIAMLATLLLAAGLIAACGGDDKADYGQEVEDVLKPLGEELQSLGTELSAASDEQGLIDGLSAAEAEIDNATSALESIDVPSDVEQVNQDLIAAISGFGDELAKVRTAAEQGDTAQLQTLATALPQIATDFQAELSRVQDAAKEAGVPIDNSDG
ncbi:MAG: hypothetical protein WBF18_05630 [Solirubrobacterales bacterium]